MPSAGGRHGCREVSRDALFPDEDGEDPADAEVLGHDSEDPSGASRHTGPLGREAEYEQHEACTDNSE